MFVVIIGAFVALCFIPLVEDQIRERRVLRQHRDRHAEASKPVRAESPARALNALRGFHAAKYERIALEQARDDVVKQVAQEVLEEVRQRLKEDE